MCDFYSEGLYEKQVKEIEERMTIAMEEIRNEIINGQNNDGRKNRKDCMCLMPQPSANDIKMLEEIEELIKQYKKLNNMNNI